MSRYDFGTGLDRYQNFVLDRWAGHPAPGRPKRIGRKAADMRDLYIMSTGLPGESGEVCELLKKHVRDGKLDTEKLKKELGDVLFYLTRIALRFDLTLDEIILANVAKLEDRAKRNVLHGSGDDR